MMRPYSKSSAGFSLLYALLFAMIASPVSASISVGVTLYNSESSVSERVTLENANYASSITLLPYTGFADFPSSIQSSGAGESTSSKGTFSHSISASHPGESSKNVDASVEIDSGLFRWSKTVDTSSYDTRMGIGISTKIVNGNLDSSYSNSDSTTALKDISMHGGVYSDKTYITPESLSSAGSGSSLDDTNTWFSSCIEAESKEKKVTINSVIYEKIYSVADQKWNDKIILGPDSAFASQTLSMLSNNKCELIPMPKIQDGPITAGMIFKSTFADTEKNIFEIKTVPKEGPMMSFTPINRLLPPNMGTFETTTLSQSAKWF